MRTWLEQAHVDNPMPPAPVLPARYAAAALTDVGQAEVHAVAERYLQDFASLAVKGFGPVFLGTSREYKTVAAAALAKEIWKTHQVEVVFAACGSMLTIMDLDRHSDATRRYLLQWCTAPVLIMDDFAAARPDTFGADIIRTVSVARFDSLRPTIWTGNLELPRGQEFAHIGSLYGSLFARRLEDSGRGFTALVD